MGPVPLRTSDQHELTGNLLSTIDYHPAPARIPGAPFCLGETPDLRNALFNKLDLRYSFHHIVWAEYGGQQQLHVAVQNYRTNWALDTTLPDQQHLMPYEKALRNLIVLMFGHYIDVFECHSSRFGHRTILFNPRMGMSSGSSGPGPVPPVYQERRDEGLDSQGACSQR